MDFSIKEIYPHIYHLHFGSGYDVAMHFLRFQEYYESPKFYKKIFTLIEYMEWYAKKHGEGAFTYPSDWSGFNDPSWVLNEVRDAEIPDPNKYDRFMFNLIDTVREKEGAHAYYFIGTSKESSDGAGKSDVAVLDHEIAHAFFTVRSDYRREVGQLLLNWISLAGHKKEELEAARRTLMKME